MPHEAPIWTLRDVQSHLEAAVGLEFWTIPFYMSAMYSIEDRSDPACQLLQTVVYQEMLHLELAANIANAFGCELELGPPRYVGREIPHLNFRIDQPDPRKEFHPYSAEIGPLDVERANAMCLIEYPKWASRTRPDPSPKTEEYGSIGELYRALSLGMTERAADISGGRNQVDWFGRFYQNTDRFTVQQSGVRGLAEALRLLQVITTQGEGETRGERDVPTSFQNTADDLHANWAHFRKFMHVRRTVLDGRAPSTYHGVAEPPAGSAGHVAQQTLVRDFRVLCERLRALFAGQNPDDFAPRMAKVGASISNCWMNGAIPKFS